MRLFLNTLQNFVAASLAAGNATANVKERAAIVNGYSAPDRPFYVSLQNIGSCGGTIISNNYVLTAAHCVEGMRTINVIYGDFTHGGTQRRVSGTVKSHENYNSDTYLNDIAIIRLYQPVPSAMAIPLCTKSYKDSPIAVCGMGRTIAGHNNVAENLQEVKMKETSCSKYHKSNKERICLTGNNRDSCVGDSGGPAYPFSGNKPVCLYGVVSSGSKFCEGWGFYSRVPYYRQWIKDNLN